MTPDIVIIGAQRAGTTTLFRLLNDHPQVVRPTVSKGTAFFDLNYSRGMTWYRGHFPVKQLARLSRRRSDLMTFESCGYYMVHPLAPSRLARDLPGVRAVAMLRNPADRAHSAHKHELRRGFEDLDFEAAIDAEPDRIAGEVERIVSDPTYHSYELQHHAYLARGHYDEHLSRYFDAIGKDRVYVVDADTFFQDTESEFGKLTDWLGLERSPYVDGSAWNAEPRDPLSPELRRRLAAYFRPHDERLSELLGWRPSWVSDDASVVQGREDAF